MTPCGAAVEREPAKEKTMGRLTGGRIGSGFVLLMAVALGVGCASARVRNVEADRSVPLPRPARVLVFDFDAGAADVRVGASTRRSAARLSMDESNLLGDAVADTLASKLVESISSQGLSAERASGATLPALNDLVLQGQFVRVDEGSQVKRFVIGFGVGATELRTQVEVFQVTAEGWRPIKQFDTVATGSRLPGAGWFVAGGAAAGTVALSAAVSSGVGVIRELRASIDADAGRTAEQIANKVSELSSAQRW
jgi:hypothetical protein